MKLGKRFIMLLTLLVTPTIAIGADEEEEPKVVYKQRTEIDFEGVEIEGELVKPQGQLVLDRRHAKFNPMIKLRVDFDQEMEDSVKEVK